MTTPAERLLRLYSAALALFPTRFRLEYGSEMQAVFSSACRQAASNCPHALGRLALREARDLPVSIMREHLSEFKRAVMKSTYSLSWTPSRSALRGALLFAATFLLVYLLPAVLDTIINYGVPMDNSHSILIGHWTYQQALACGLGIYLLSRNTQPGRALTGGVLAAVGIALFFRVEMFVPLFRNPAAIQVVVLRVTATFIPEMIKGALAGLALAWASGRMKSWALHAVSGSLGFSLGWLVVALLGSTLVAQIQVLSNSSEVIIGSLWYFIYEVGLMVPYGLVLGSVLAMGSVTRQPSPLAA